MMWPFVMSVIDGMINVPVAGAVIVNCAGVEAVPALSSEMMPDTPELACHTSPVTGDAGPFHIAPVAGTAGPSHSTPLSAAWAIAVTSVFTWVENFRGSLATTWMLNA